MVFFCRLWFQPAFVKAPSSPSDSITVVSLFGWTIGESVVLEYDHSPVGPYQEFVSLGGVVWKRGALGQWGSRLFVSSRQAKELCENVWNLPAQLADISLNGEGTLSVEAISDNVQVRGWQTTRTPSKSRWNLQVEIVWTPSIKALWTPTIFLPDSSKELVPMHHLRLSSSSVRLVGGFGIVADNVLIEISQQCGFL